MAGKNEIFDPLFKWYDILNTVFSLGVDKVWRKRCAKSVISSESKIILDVASGTGKMVYALKKNQHKGIVVALDPSINMIKYGKRKSKFSSNNYFRCSVVCGTSERLPFQDNSFDAVTCTFGLRNFNNLKDGLREILRVLKEGGKFASVEVTIPEKKFLKFLFRPYFEKIMPLVGDFITKTGAYTYLKQSVLKFPERRELLNIFRNSGFVRADYENLTGGIAVLYRAYKPFKSVEVKAVA